MATLLTEPADAHLDVRPGIVQVGVPVELLVELPRLRPGARPVGLEIEGDGLRVLAGPRLVDAVAAETLWTARVRVDSEPGSLLLILRALYADGRSVEVDDSVVVLGDEDAGFPWWTVALGAAVAVGLAAVVLVVARRRA